MLRLSTRTLYRRAALAPCSRRLYATGNLSGSEGATASARGSFSEKEKAIENQWARSNDAERIKALHDALEKHQQVTESLKRDLEALKKSLK